MTLTETSFATTSYSLIFFRVCKLCKSGYKLFIIFLEVSRYTRITYIERYLVLTYIERFFSTVCCFFSYIFWSVNCLSWVSKFHNFFLTCSEINGMCWVNKFNNLFLICLEIEAKFIFECFKYCTLRKVPFQHSSTFLAFFIWSVNCPRDFFSHFVSQ